MLYMIQQYTKSPTLVRGPVCKLSLHTSPLHRNKRIALFSASTYLVSSTILDGVRQTVTHNKIKLCAVHLEPDSTPAPMLDAILDFPALELSDSATEDRLQRIQTEDEPLDIIDPSSPGPRTSLRFANWSLDQGRASWILPIIQPCFL